MHYTWDKFDSGVFNHFGIRKMLGKKEKAHFESGSLSGGAFKSMEKSGLISTRASFTQQAHDDHDLEAVSEDDEEDPMEEYPVEKPAPSLKSFR